MKDNIDKVGKAYLGVGIFDFPVMLSLRQYTSDLSRGG